MKITIVTPCSRPGNLPALYDSVTATRQRFPGVEWWIVHDADPDSDAKSSFPGWVSEWFVRGGGHWGHEQRNWAIDEIRSGLVYFLDDDNLMHPDFTCTPGRVTALTQERFDGRLWVKARQPKVGAVDSGSVVFPIDLVGDVRFPMSYDGDGVFFTALHAQNPDVWDYLTDRPRAFYNALR